jgi:hypothetical protein
MHALGPVVTPIARTHLFATGWTLPRSRVSRMACRHLQPSPVVEACCAGSPAPSPYFRCKRKTKLALRCGRKLSRAPVPDPPPRDGSEARYAVGTFILHTHPPSTGDNSAFYSSPSSTLPSRSRVLARPSSGSSTHTKNACSLFEVAWPQEPSLPSCGLSIHSAQTYEPRASHRTHAEQTKLERENGERESSRTLPHPSPIPHPHPHPQRPQHHR